MFDKNDSMTKTEGIFLELKKKALNDLIASDSKKIKKEDYFKIKNWFDHIKIECSKKEILLYSIMIMFLYAGVYPQESQILFVKGLYEDVIRSFPSFPWMKLLNKSMALFLINMPIKQGNTEYINAINILLEQIEKNSDPLLIQQLTNKKQTNLILLVLKCYSQPMFYLRTLKNIVDHPNTIPQIRILALKCIINFLSFSNKTRIIKDIESKYKDKLKLLEP